MIKIDNNTNLNESTLAIGAPVTALVSPGNEIIGKVMRIEGRNIVVRDAIGALHETIESLCDLCDISFFWAERENARIGNY